VSARARALLGEAIGWDNHGCMPMRPDARWLPQLQRYRAAGCSTVSINGGYGLMDWDEHVSLLSFMRGWLMERPADYVLVHTAQDVELARRTGRLGVVFDVEGMVPVQDDPTRVRRLYELGVRWMLVAYNRNNAAGGGCMDDDRGLSDIGRQVIDEMAAAGMVLCVSHCGARTAREALDYTRSIPILSHSNPRAVTDHPRNVTDELMAACAARGGVVGLNGIGPFLGAGDGLVAAFMRHIRHVIDLVGPGHVGLSLDYVFDREDFEADVQAHPMMHSPGVSGSLAMIEPEDIPEIVDGLCGLGLSDAEVCGILGDNWLRIARQVWK
jgi:membrane dipeptidase